MHFQDIDWNWFSNAFSQGADKQHFRLVPPAALCETMAMREPLVSDAQWEKIEPLLPRVEKPGRYIGGEKNAILKLTTCMPMTAAIGAKCSSPISACCMNLASMHLKGRIRGTML